MRYASPSDLASRFGYTELAQVATPDRYQVVSADLLQLVVNSGDASAYTAEEVEAANATLQRINDALKDAADEIDFYLSTQYTLPFNPVPPMLLKLACDLARYNLHQSSATDEVKDRHKNATRILEQLSDGRLQLGVNLNNDALKPAPNLPQSTSSERVFTHDTLQDF